MKLIIFLKKLSKKQPFTSRGLILFVLAFVCLFYFGKEKSDLVATVIGITIAIACIMTLLPLLLTSRFIFKKFADFRDLSTGSNEKYFAQKEFSSFINLPAIKIPPFFNISLTRVFPEEHNEHVKPKTIKLFGNFNDPRSKFDVKDYLKFDRRGEFTQAGVAIRFGDILGLTRLEKFIPAAKNYAVHPQEVQIEPIAVMAASAQLGDVEHSNLERTGDLFDIRGYHPGDSLKRVLWKVYARSGNVVVRQPEPAIVPEGEVAIFVAARAEDDCVAASAISYLKILEEQNIVYSLSSLGHFGELAKTIEEAESNLINSANLAMHDNGQSFQRFLEKLKEKNFSSKKIILFCPEFLSSDDSRYEEEVKVFRKIEVQASQFGVELAIVIAPKKLSFDEKQSSYLAAEDQKAKELDETWLDKFNTNTEKVKFDLKFSKLNPFRKSARDLENRRENIQTIFYDKEVIQVKYNDV